MFDEPLIVKPPCSDVQALWFGKVDGKYIITHKTMHGHARRSVCIAESEDFRNWSPSRLILTSDLYDPPDTEYHGMVGFPYADMYLGLAERWINTPNHIELLLVWSHDRKTWHRPIPREPFIGPTYYWNQGWNTCNSAGPLQVGNQLRFYFNGQSGSHFHVKPSGPRKLGVIGMATITVDRFASITAGFMEGQLVTKPMTWPGGDLLMKFVPRERTLFHRVYRFPIPLWASARERAIHEQRGVRWVVNDALDAELESVVAELRSLGFRAEGSEDNKLVRLPVDDTVVNRIREGRRCTGLPGAQLLRICLQRYLAHGSPPSAER